MSLDNDTDLVFYTLGPYAAGGAGDDEDISTFTVTATLNLNLTTLGIDPSEDVDGVHRGR